MPRFITEEEIPQRSYPGRGKSLRQQDVDKVIADAEDMIDEVVAGESTAILFDEFHASRNEVHRLRSPNLPALKNQCREAVRKALDELNPSLREDELIALRFGWDGYTERTGAGEYISTGFDVVVTKGEGARDEKED